MGGKLVLHCYGAPGIQRKRHRRRIREVERDAPPLDDPAVDVAPLDVEKPLSGYWGLEAVQTFDRLVPFYSLWQHKLVSRGRPAEQIANSHEQCRNPREPRRDEASWSTDRRCRRKASPPACA